MKPLPDPYPIEPLTKSPNCTITVPGSKSITNRALILAALAKGKCTLRGALWADDTQVMVDSLKRLGFDIRTLRDTAETANKTLTVEGHGGVIPKKAASLRVGNAGTAARFLTALVALGNGEYKLSGDPRMHERPMGDLFDSLRSIGVTVLSSTNRLPAVIRTKGIRGGTVKVSARSSSQFASALLLISRVGMLDVKLEETDEPHGYFEMTSRMMETFKPNYSIEPDLSSASYFIAASWITGGSIKVAGWPKQSIQIDGEFKKYLPPPLEVSRLRDLGDSVMTLAICALFGKQPLRLTDASRLREQETDRIKAMVKELQRVGAKAEEHENGFTVWPATTGAIARCGH